MSLDPYFNKAELWPVSFSLFGRTIFTFWGCACGDTDYILSKENEILLFASTNRLKEFILSSHSCIFSTLPGYIVLKELISKIKNLKHCSIDNYDFLRTGNLLSNFLWKNWKEEDRADIVYPINMLWDASITLSNEYVRSVLRQNSTSEISPFLSEMTFSNDNTDFSKYNSERIYQEYVSIIGSICLKCKIIS